jgi:hypothetical protein
MLTSLLLLLLLLLSLLYYVGSRENAGTSAGGAT